MTKHRSLLEKHLFLTVLIAVIITGGLTITSLTRTSSLNVTSILCTFSGGGNTVAPAGLETTPNHLKAILHYATTRAVPQQAPSEIRVTFDLLRSMAPCNFLVFGLGHDSLMWSTFNPRGTTVFLEEDIKRVHRTLIEAPILRVHPLRFTTRLSDAHQLLFDYRSIENCVPPEVYLKSNTRCTLALSEMPDEVYEREWDVILIDGPRGYFDEAPGRMSVIFTAAVMARARTGTGVTHVLLHDANRKVEKAYAQEFLCMRNLVRAEGRLWHFEIPPAATKLSITAGNTFC